MPLTFGIMTLDFGRGQPARQGLIGGAQSVSGTGVKPLAQSS